MARRTKNKDTIDVIYAQIDFDVVQDAIDASVQQHVDAKEALVDAALAEVGTPAPAQPTKRFHVAWIITSTWPRANGNPYTQTSVYVDTLHDWGAVVEKIDVPPGPGGRYVAMECTREYCTAPERTHKALWGIE